MPALFPRLQAASAAMIIDANLLYGLELGFGVGLALGLIVGVILMVIASKAVRLPW